MHSTNTTGTVSRSTMLDHAAAMSDYIYNSQLNNVIMKTNH